MSALNVFFHVTHILTILFLLSGWAFQRTRKIHLILVLLTIFSWAGLGYFFGWGYCFWTDWHWQVRDRLGLQHPASYIKLLTDSVTAKNWDAATVDYATVTAFLLVVVFTAFAKIREMRRAS